MKNKIFVFIALLALTAPLFAQKKKAGASPEGPKVEDKPLLPPPVKMTSVEGITEYRLQNGLRVLLFPRSI